MGGSVERTDIAGVGTAPAAPQVSLKDVGVRAGSRNLLREVNWDIEEGSRWVVIGENGSGKTTLLSLIAACNTPTTGTIAWRGTPYAQMQAIDVRRQIGFVSSSWFARMYRNESVRDVLLSGACGTFGVDEANPLELPFARMRRLLAAIDLPEKEDLSFASLSRGQQQMVLILRALMAHPSMLVLDELTAGLDVTARQAMRLFVRGIAARRPCTLVYVTHYFEEISPDFFDGAMLVKRGAVFAKGPLESVLVKDVLDKFLEHPVEIARDEEGMYELRFEDGEGGWL